MRLLADQNLPPSVLVPFREAGHDAVHVQDKGLERATDEEIFALCCAEDRVLLTADKKLTKFLAASQTRCPSVVIVRDVRTLPVADLGRLLVLNLPAMADVIESLGNAVFTLAPSKPIRAALLPLGLPRSP